MISIKRQTRYLLKYDFGYAYGAKPGFALEWRMKNSLVEPTSSTARKQLSSAEVFHAAVWADERLDGSVDGGHVGSLARMHQKIVPSFMRPHDVGKKSSRAGRRPDGVICVPASTTNRPLRAQVLLRQRRHRHRSPAFRTSALQSEKCRVPAQSRFRFAACRFH